MEKQNNRLIAQSRLRIGTGFDLHRLVPGRKLILGGIHIPYDMGLAGHSDGDALLHAIMDALLGAANLGEIGLFFSPEDVQFADANSADLLVQVRDMLTEKKYAIVNLDSVIICQRPKLAHLYGGMSRRISELLHIDLERVSLKAKTAEEIGEIGQGQAIAVQSTALLEQL